MDKVSIIIPVYKTEKYLHQCLDSVTAQTYTNLEIILVDDGSPDNCGAICDEYAKRDERVKVIHQKNKGVSQARNTGIESSTGEWLMFVDSDDVVSCRFVEYLKHAQEDAEADLAYCSISRFNDQETPIDSPGPYEHQKVASYTSNEALENTHAIWYTPNMCNKLVNKQLLTNIQFPNATRAEDLWLSYYLLTVASKIASLQFCQLYYYRQHSNSAMHSTSLKYIEDDLQMRINVYQSFIRGKYLDHCQSFSTQTYRIFLDYLLCILKTKDDNKWKTSQYFGKLLSKEMWLPLNKSLFARIELFIMYHSVYLWLLIQLFKHKLFRIPLYK